MSSNSAGDDAPTHKAAKLFRTYAGEHPEFLIITLMLTSIPSAILILALVLTHGNITTFHSLDVRGGFRSGSEGRGTLSLVWSCVSTIFTLIYVSVHLDIPNEHPVGPSRNRFHAAVRSVWRPIRSNLPLIFWMLLNVFTPSLLVLVASMEYQSARDGVEFMRVFSDGRWTMRHAFFADMGGFELEGQPLLTGRKFYEYVKDKTPHLDYDKIQEEIRDRSNKNTVLKVLTFFQASWFIAQSIVRGVEQRAISQLEVTTCAYIFSLMVAYLFWIRKPYHINGRVPLEYMLETSPNEEQHHQLPDDPASPCAPSLSPSTPISPSLKNPADIHPAGSQGDVERGALPSQQNPGRPPLDRRPSGWKKLSSYVLSFRRKPLPQRVEPPGPLFQNTDFSPFNRAMYDPHKSWAYSCFTSGIVGSLVGLIHLLPFWNYDFTNPMGQILWRVCGTVQVVLSFGLATNSVLERYTPAWCLRPLWIGVVIMSFAYCVSRFVIFILIWYSFASLPDAVYDSIDWSWFPHWY